MTKGNPKPMLKATMSAAAILAASLTSAHADCDTLQSQLGPSLDAFVRAGTESAQVLRNPPPTYNFEGWKVAVTMRLQDYATTGRQLLSLNHAVLDQNCAANRAEREAAVISIESKVRKAEIWVEQIRSGGVPTP